MWHYPFNLLNFLLITVREKYIINKRIGGVKSSVFEYLM